MNARLLMMIFKLGLAGLLAGCHVEAKKSTKAEAYTYDFTENQCATGAHSSNSVPGICAKLEDHVLNRNCAYGMRASKYQSYNCAVVLGSKPAALSEEVNLNCDSGDCAYTY